MITTALNFKSMDLVALYLPWCIVDEEFPTGTLLIGVDETYFVLIYLLISHSVILYKHCNIAQTILVSPVGLESKLFFIVGLPYIRLQKPYCVLKLQTSVLQIEIIFK